MGPKIIILLCLAVLCVEAQRDNRRRSGRRKPTTEMPPPAEPENETNPQKLDGETEAIAKPANTEPLETETSAPSSPKESSNSSGGPPFIVPRATRKPRPMVTHGSGEGRSKPTLPTFTRKSQGRMPKPDRTDLNKKTEEKQFTSSTTTTTRKPSSRNSRRRNTSKASEKSTPSTVKSEEPSEVSSEAPPKKRFGGRRNSQRGSRRSTTAVPEE